MMKNGLFRIFSMIFSKRVQWIWLILETYMQLIFCIKLGLTVLEFSVFSIFQEKFISPQNYAKK